MKKLLITTILLLCSANIFARDRHLNNHVAIEVYFVNSLGYDGCAYQDLKSGAIVGNFKYGTSEKSIRAKLYKFCDFMEFPHTDVKLTVETKEHALKEAQLKLDNINKEIGHLSKKIDKLNQERIKAFLEINRINTLKVD